MTSATDTQDWETQSCTCTCTCGYVYTIAEFRTSNAMHFDPPENYARGCETCRLGCWLGVPPGGDGNQQDD